MSSQPGVLLVLIPEKIEGFVKDIQQEVCSKSNMRIHQLWLPLGE